MQLLGRINQALRVDNWSEAEKCVVEIESLTYELDLLCENDVFFTLLQVSAYLKKHVTICENQHTDMGMEKRQDYDFENPSECMDNLSYRRGLLHGLISSLFSVDLRRTASLASFIYRRNLKDIVGKIDQNTS
ncbi:hypothetical protein PhaeoP30_00678 [Phaeobacter inhibens]|nr:hypothetical protein PhaeoP30_00678 [Phaeobacter inhibens]